LKELSLVHHQKDNKMNKTIIKISTLFLLIFFVISCHKSERKLDSVPSKYFSVDDFNVHYKEFGEGDKTLVFIHGWGCDLNTWKYQFDHFKDQYHLVLIDLPGYGQSDKTEKDYSIDFFAQSVLEIISDLQITKPVLIAHSMGLPVAMEVLKQLDNDSAMLCNIDGVYFDFPADSTEKQQFKEGLSGFANMFKGENYTRNVEQFCQGFITETTPENVSDYILSTMTGTPEMIGFQSMNSLIDQRYWDKKIINNRSIAIYAKIAELSPDNEDILREQFPNLTYIEMDGVNHFLMMEKPKEVNELLKEFVEK
jgi:pimeloyl-ACP methyl ester carboxylesterase